MMPRAPTALPGASPREGWITPGRVERRATERFIVAAWIPTTAAAPAYTPVPFECPAADLPTTRYHSLPAWVTPL